MSNFTAVSLTSRLLFSLTRLNTKENLKWKSKWIRKSETTRRPCFSACRSASSCFRLWDACFRWASFFIPRPAGNRSDHLGMHYLFPVCIRAAVHQYVCFCSYNGMVIYRWTGFQHAGAGGDHQDGWPCGKGYDGPVNQYIISIFAKKLQKIK